MATADQYAEWIVANEAKKGTPDFEEVAKAYREAKAEEARPSMSKFLQEKVPESASKFGGGLLDMIQHPIDTARGVRDVVAGGLVKATPQPVLNLLDAVSGTPETRSEQGRVVGVANSVGNLYKDRYGGVNETLKTIYNDPVGVAADVSTLFTGGAGAARGLGSASKAVGALETAAAKYTNPLSIASPILNTAGTVAKTVGGGFSGVGGESLSQAARSGMKSGAGLGADEFVANLRGNVPQTDVLAAARAALDKMTKDKQAAYKQDMAAVSADKTVLDFKGIDKALSDASDMTTFKGQVKNVSASDAVSKMRAAVDEWKNLDPKEFHTPEGLDALKQKLGGVLESIPLEEKTARLAAGKVYQSVKNEIVQQAPTYAKTMKQYADLSEEISQIEKSLSLGQKVSLDTAIRKLQSLSRNNANTNYGARLSLAKTLEQKGGAELMPAIAGQSLNSWAPRGMHRLGAAGLAGSGVMLQNPLAIPLLLGTSPRLLGELTYKGGQAAGLAGRGIGALGITPDRARLAGLLGSRVPEDAPDW